MTMPQLHHIIAALTGVIQADLTRPFLGASVDSRQIVKNNLFVAVNGENVDGHAYLSKAFENGATLALIDQEVSADFTVLDLRAGFTRFVDQGGPLCVRVESSVAALQIIAKYWRQQLPVRIIGITGSVGKTTTKEVTAAVLSQRYKTLKNKGNLNNEIGLPLTMMSLDTTYERAVLEMGFYVPGEIKFLCDIALPSVGVITNVFPVHAERAGSLENIVAGKSELIQSLPNAPHGVAILNADQPHVANMRNLTNAKILTYGVEELASLYADNVSGMGLAGVKFRMHYDGDTIHLTVPMLGRHSVQTSLRATAVGLAEGMAWQDIVTGLRQQSPETQLRLSVLDGIGGSVILDDTYNASPESTIAALNLLEEVQGTRKIAVLGDMLELGYYEEIGHRMVGGRASDVADVLITVGKLGEIISDEALRKGMRATVVRHFADQAAAAAYLKTQVHQGDVVLVKGSRGLRLDQLVTALDIANE